MKKFLSFLLAGAMIAGLAACSPSATTSTEAPSAAPTQAPADEVPEETETPAEDPAAEAPAERTDGLPAYTGEPVELRFGWWGNDARAELTQQVIDKFEAAYPEITILGEPNGGTSDHFAIIDTQLQGNSAPDLIQFGGNYPDYLTYLAPLSSYVGNQLQIDGADKFDQAVLETGSQSGELYAVSLGTNALVLAYNKTVLETAGAELPPDTMTWDEMIEYGRKIKPLLPEGVFPFVDNSVNQANYLSYYSRQINEPMWTAEEKSYSTEAGLKKWIDIWEDMRAEGLIPDISTTASYAETGADSSALVEGKAVIGLLWSNNVMAYQEAMTDKLDVCPLPVGDNNGLAIQVSQFLGINKASANIEAAVLFINYFVTSPDAGEILGTNRGVPSSPIVRTAIAGSASEIDGIIYNYYNLVADRTIPQDPNLPNDQEFVAELLSIGQSVAFGQTSREDAAKNLLDLINRLLVKA
ncbi:MAG: extracellular solute-binding protein [Clostridiales bacterium]|jgi:multiple sugar transport system substrate-binding protein|nr:extracellular solute-binding protein [Clostridiales bacterium]